jgi:flavin-dependent dehydrogenase
VPERFNVAIVGGGPAGSSCARHLLSSRRFTRRVVLDRWFLS